jgi:hypothetical protein
MGKVREPHPFEDNPFIDGLLDWMASPEGQLSIEAGDIICSMLEHADVDAKKRKIVWEDGQRLSITESARCIHAEHPHLPLNLIETHVVEWLLQDFAPETYSREQLDELDRLTEKWTDEHERRQAKARLGRKRGRTTHS